MPKDWNVTTLLSHSRHDWLNHLQLINGYISMGRMEKVKDLIDELVNRAKNESQLSSLNMDNLAEELLTFNWGSHSFILQFEVMSNNSDWSRWEKISLSFFQDMVSALDSCSKVGNEQWAVVTISDIDKKTIEFEFQGSLIINDHWKEKVSLLQRQYEHHIEQIEWNESECYVKFCVDC